MKINNFFYITKRKIFFPRSTKGPLESLTSSALACQSASRLTSSRITEDFNFKVKEVRKILKIRGKISASELGMFFKEDFVENQSETDNLIIEKDLLFSPQANTYQEATCRRSIQYYHM